VDSAWEQKKLEASLSWRTVQGKMLENGGESHLSSAPPQEPKKLIFGREKPGRMEIVYSEKASTQAVLSNGAGLRAARSAPWLPDVLI
jgi:hypothetical protein